MLKIMKKNPSQTPQTTFKVLLFWAHTTRPHPPWMLKPSNSTFHAFVCKSKAFYALPMATDGDQAVGLELPAGDEGGSGGVSAGQSPPWTEAGS